MGSITTPLDGETKYVGELITITYNSGALAFGGGAGEIASLQYTLNGVPKATKNMQPATAPATHSYTMAMPVNAGPAVIQVHARNINNLVLETVTVTLNLIAIPSATCAGSTNQAMDGLTFNGALAGIPVGGSARFRFGTVNGGPYATNAPATPYAVGAVSAAVTGLTAGTVYYYVLEVLDAAGVAVAVSPQCSGQTLLDAGQAGPACPVPPYVDECPPKQVYTVGGVDYIAYQFCDKATNTPILVVYQLCDGVPSGTPTYYDLAGQPYTPAGAVGLCDTGLDYETLCDKGTDPNTRILALWDTSTVPPTLKYFTPAIDGSLVAYTPVGPVSDCPETDTEESQICYLAINDGIGYAAGDQLLQILFWDTGEIPPVLTSTIWRNQTQNRVMASAPTFADLVPCADKDHEVLTFCDDNGPFLRRYSISGDGSVVVTDTALNGVTAYTPVGTIKICQPSDSSDIEIVTLCDDNGPFLRFITRNVDGSITANDTQLDGVTAYLPVGTVKSCSAPGKSLIQACDKTTTATGATPGICGTNQQTADAVDIQDAEEKNPTTGASAVNVNDNDLEMAGQAEAGETDYQIGVRFALNVPKGAKICSAYIQFTSRSTTSFGTLIATIRGEAADTSAPFTTTAGMLTARAKTTANVSWNVPLWPTSGQAGAAQRTPDLSTIVQEIVDRAGWVAGNNTAFIFTPGATGYRRAQSLPSGTAVAPKLHVEYVLDTPGGSTDVCVPFYKEIDLSTGLATGNNYRLNAGTWSAYTPTGTVTDGNCLCPGTPGDGGTDFELLCMTDSANTKFVRVVAIDGTTGGYKKIGDYALDFSGEYNPVGTVAPCSDSFTSTDTELAILCDDVGAFLRHITYDANGTVQTVINTALDGLTAYTITGTVKKCADCCPTVLGEGCWNNGVTSGEYVALRDSFGVVTLYDKATGAVVNAANVVSCTVQRSSTIQRQVGAGTVTVASGARSLSIVVLSGQPTVSIGAGAAVALATGISLNWGASSDKEVLTDAFSFTCAAGDDLIVTTIR